MRAAILETYPSFSAASRTLRDVFSEILLSLRKTLETVEALKRVYSAISCIVTAILLPASYFERLYLKRSKFDISFSVNSVKGLRILPLHKISFGKSNLSEPSEELYALLRRTREIYSQRIAGKMLSGADSDYENEIIEKIDEFMKKETGK